MTGKIPPHNIEAEQAVLGSMLLDKEGIEKADEILDSDGKSFYHDIHGKIYKAMIDLYRQQIPVDLLTCCEEFKGTNTLDPLGGEPYLAVLIEMVPTTANVGYYINIVKEKAGLRKIISSCIEIASRGYDNESLDAVIDNFQSSSLGVENNIKTNYESLSDISKDMLSRLAEGGYTGISTGMVGLDKLTGGIQRGTLTSVSARPSQGKTTFAMDLACRQAEQGYSVGIFQIETSKDDMSKNAIARLTGINSMKFRLNDLSDAEWSIVNAKIKNFDNLKLIIDDQTNYFEDIVKQIRKMYKEAKVDTIIIDYLGLIESRSKTENRNLELGSYTRRLKALAKELDISIIVLCQLNRGLEHRENKKPELSDIRDSGEIEQDVDLSIMLYWEGKYNKEVLGTDRANVTDIIINKHRNGPIGDIEMLFKKEVSKFEDIVDF